MLSDKFPNPFEFCKANSNSNSVGNLDFLTKRRDFVGKKSGQSLSENIDLFGPDMGLLMAQKEEQTPTVTRSFTKDQVKILEGVIDSLEIQQGRLTEGKLFDDVERRINAIKEALSAEDVDENVLQKLREELIELETVGTDAQQVITKLATAPQNLNNAAEQFGRALASFRQGATPLTQITESIGLTGETLLGLTTGNMTESLAQFKNLGGQVDKVIDSNTLGFLQTILGKDALSKFVTQRDGKDIVKGTGTATGDLDIIREIVSKCDLKIEIGGGVRKYESIKQYIDAGVEKVILGSGAIKNKEFLKDSCEKFKGQIALGLDAKDGNLSVSGWKENLNVKTIDFLKEVNNYGVSRIIYTDINRDGMKTSPNFDETVKIAELSNCPVVISGGVSSINDIKKAKDLNNKKIEGIIVGKAIYDGDIKLEDLVKEIN